MSPPTAQRHLWRTCRIDGQPPDRERAWLTTPERRRADAIGHPAARHRFVAGRGLVRRTILELRPELAGSELVLVIAPSGRPSVARHPGLDISISHTGDLVAVAVAVGQAIGIDVERMARETLPPVEVWLAGDEQRRLAGLPGPVVQRWLMRRWVAKEAVIKLDAGDRLARRDMAVDDDANGDATAIVRRVGTSGATGPRTGSLGAVRFSVVDGYLAALAVRSPTQEAVRWS